MFKPELRRTQNDTPVTDFNLAMTERWKSKTGEDRQETTWVKVVCWGRLAESVSPVVDKGDLVYVEGKITTREYEKDGVKNRVTEIEANNVLKMDSSRRGSDDVEVVEA